MRSDEYTDSLHHSLDHLALGKRRVMAFTDLQTRQNSQSDAARSRFCSAVNPNQANKPCLSAR